MLPVAASVINVVLVGVVVLAVEVVPVEVVILLLGGFVICPADIGAVPLNVLENHDNGL